MTTPAFGDAAGAIDSLSVTPTLFPAVTDVPGAAIDTISVTSVSLALTAGDAAGAVDEIHVVKYLLPPIPNQSNLADLTPNPNFSVAGVASTSTWFADNGTISASSSVPPIPAGAPQATAAQYVNGGSTQGGIRVVPASAVTLVKGTGYLITCWLNSSASSVYIGFDWYDATRTFISSTVSSTFGIPTGQWVQLAWAAPGGSAIPANAVFMAPHIGSPTLSMSMWVTQVITTAQAPTYSPANPAFIKSQMPRMHVQNLVTKQWYHRDVQGVTAPLITWNLNNPDTFSCTLSPPRPDMLDSTGNPVLSEWRDAVYLEENDTIRFGGILTSSSFNGPQWQLTATGFGGYANGMPYEGPNVTKYKYDALDAVRYLWNWLQAQPGGGLGLMLDPLESGVLLGSSITNLASGTLSRAAKKDDTSIWFTTTQVSSFASGMSVTINGIAYQIKTVVTNTANTATGQVTLTFALREAHSAGEEVLQVPAASTLSADAASGQAVIQIKNAGPFTQGMAILIGGQPYTISTVTTNSSGAPTGKFTLSSNLAEAHKSGDTVTAAPTPFTLFWYNSTDIGQEIQSIQQEAVFDIHESHTWTDQGKTDVLHKLSFGVPRIGTRRSDLRFAEGENVVQAVQVTRDGTNFADHVWGLGAGSGAASVRADVSALTGQRLTRSYVYTDQTVTTTARLSAKIQRVLTARQNMDSPTQVVVKNHPNAPFGSFSPGDDIPVRLATGWRSGIIWCRITAMSQDPTTDIMTLTVARSDSFTYMTETGQAGTI